VVLATATVPPVAIPVPIPIVATEGVLLLHVPLPELVSVVDVPLQILSVPPIAAGRAFTVTIAVVAQPPVPNVYVTVLVPRPAMPVNTPVATSIVPTAGLLLLQAPPLLAFVRLVVAPWHTLRVPPIDAGKPYTVTTVVAAQPLNK
jgi:hypothetical protein